jgi:hypothetical protein
MKTLFTSILAFTLMITTTCGLSFARDTHASKAVKHAGAAGSHASRSAAHSVAASGQVVSGVIAVPLMSAGAMGAASAQAGEALWEASAAPAHGPLEISEETVTAGPAPDQAILPRDM